MRSAYRPPPPHLVDELVTDIRERIALRERDVEGESEYRVIGHSGGIRIFRRVDDGYRSAYVRDAGDVDEVLARLGGDR